MSARAETDRAEGLAFLSLAKRQHRYSWEYRRWALEAERAGNLTAYNKYRAEARKLWRDAREHLKFARSRLHG